MRRANGQDKESPLDAARAGWRAVAGASVYTRVWLCCALVVTLLMLPMGRSGINDGGGLLAPLTADSGSRDLFRLRPAADFFSVYDAGARILRGNDPYGVNSDTGGKGVRAPYVATFRYLPITAFLLAVPLNVLPPWASFYTWTVLNVGFLVGNFLLCAGRNPNRLLVFSLVWFAWFPVIAELHMGQFSLFMATLLLWGFDALCSGRQWGGVCWALAVLIKVYPIGMAPSLFAWRRRWLAAGTVGLVIASTLAWRVLVPSQMDEGLVQRGVAGRFVGESRVPYAGAMGVQAMINAIGWKAMGRSLDPSVVYTSPGHDPVFPASFLAAAGFALVCLWAFLATTGSPDFSAIGLYWLAWFYFYVDCWEHHYVFLQALVGLLLAWRVIDWRTAFFCWIFGGGPSLWWLWQRTGYSGNFLAETIGTLYFIQRPIAVIALTGVLIRGLVRERGVA